MASIESTGSAPRTGRSSAGENIERRRARQRGYAAARYTSDTAPVWTCEHCGVAFHRMPGPHGPARFCSKACTDLAKIGGAPRGTSAERFWAKVDRSGGPDACWPWTGAHHPMGYGRLYFRGRMRPATHAALLFGRGIEVGTGLARHTCDNPPCCNPAHLITGSRIDNAQDAVERGRLAVGERNHLSRLDDTRVRQIRDLAGRGLSHRAIAEAVGTSQATVTRVVNRTSWRHVV